VSEFAGGSGDRLGDAIESGGVQRPLLPMELNVLVPASGEFHEFSP